MEIKKFQDNLLDRYGFPFLWLKDYSKNSSLAMFSYPIDWKILESWGFLEDKKMIIFTVCSHV